MPFTDDERRIWHEQKMQREKRPDFSWTEPPIANCICCQNPFGISAGVVTDEVAICDRCNGE